MTKLIPYSGEHCDFCGKPAICRRRINDQETAYLCARHKGEVHGVTIERYLFSGKYGDVYYA